MTNQEPVPAKQKKFFGPFPNQPGVTPSEARKNRRSRTLPPNIISIDRKQPAPEPDPATESQAQSLSSGNPLAIPSITELARALRYDVDLIYQYVHDNVKFIPTYGLHKGGLGALLDGSGNQFDQCDLMVKLLHESGYTAEYVIGEIRLTSTQWSDFLGVDAGSWALATQMLANGGIGVTGIVGTDLIFEHCWVKVDIGGTNYYFDPSMKSHTVTTGINLATATSYNRTTFLADATATATIDPGNSVKNIDAASINTRLTTYTNNLVQWIKNNNPGATFDQILGGREIVPVIGTVRDTTLSYEDSVELETDTLDGDDYIDYKCIFQFEYDLNAMTGNYNINLAFYTNEFYGRRFTMFWNGSGQAAVRIDGTQYGPLSTAKAAGAMEDARLTVYHPYATTFANSQSLQPVQGRAPSWIGTCFGVGSKQLAEVHQEFQNQFFADGYTASSEQLLGQSLSLIWDNFIGQSSNGVDILKRMGNAEIVLHHFVGFVSQATKPGTSTKIKSVSSFMSQWNTSARASGVDLASTNFTLSLFVQSLEGTASEQVTGVQSGDAIRIISICNQAGVEIFDATNSNWTTGFNVKSKLTTSGYVTSVLNEIQDWLTLGSSWRVLVPNDPTVTVGSFGDFYGYIAADGASTYSVTWFGAKGAASADGQDDTATNSNAVDNARQANGFGMPAVTLTETARVNMLNGRYEYSSTDLSVGNQGAPYELEFIRSYNSALRLSLAKVSTADNGLGFGWTHNWLMKAVVNSDGFICLGEQQVTAAAPAIATLFVMRDVALSNSALPVENFVIECEIARFLVKQFAKNVVRLQAGGSTLLFLKMPDGTYLPPMGAHAKCKLELKATPTQHFEYTTQDGVVYAYKSTGEIDTITYPFGMSITFTYTSGKLTKVSNGFRNINFTYDSFGQLATVNDGNGRTVTFTVPTSGAQAGNLTTVKDPLNKNTTYNYDQRGRLTQIFKPANPSSPIVTNIFDSLSRVMAQLDAYDNAWQFFFAGTRSEEVAPDAPNDKGRIFYYNAKGSTVRTINVLGQEATAEYDGNERITTLVFPEGNSVATTYDANGNVVTVTQNPKTGSGLLSRASTYSYETTWNKLATSTVDGKTTSFEYYAPATVGASLVKKITAPTVAAGTPVTNFEYNSKGLVTKFTDPTGVVNINTHDNTTYDLILTIADNGFVPPHLNIVTLFTYDAIGNALTAQDPLGNVSTTTYDALRQVKQVTGPTPFNQIDLFTYDDNGNLIETQRLVATDAYSQTTTKTYAIDDRLLTSAASKNFGDGAQPVPMKYEYDSLRRVSKITDSSGRTTTSNYDELSRTVSTTIDGVIQQELAYTVTGKLSSITDMRGKVTEFEYDGFDRIARITYPDASSEEITEYDKRDNVLKFVTRAGELMEYVHDSANQLVTKKPYGLAHVSLTYDLAGRIVSIGIPAIPGDPSTGTFTFGYDSGGRRIQEQAPDGKVVSLELDANGNDLKMTYPDGSQVTKTFDQLNRPVSFSGFGANANLGYDSAARRISQLNGNTTGQGYSYDQMDSLRAMTIGGLKPNPSLPMESRLNFAYKRNDVTRDINRSCSDSNFIWQIPFMKTTTYDLANDVNQYPAVDSIPYSYDDNGCLISDGIHTYGYDSECKLISVSGPASTVTYKYDALGRLAQKILGSNETRYLYAGLQRLEEYDDSGTLLRRYVYGAGFDECLWVTDTVSSAVSYLHTDELGSVILITDENGAPIQRNVFTPWGELASGSLNDIGVGFTGQFYDSDAGIYNYKGRNYSPELGRFLQPDPIRYAAGLNLYEYCASDPVNSTDPLGFEPKVFLKGYISNTPEHYNTSGTLATYGGYSTHFVAGSGDSANDVLFAQLLFNMAYQSAQQQAQMVLEQASQAAAAQAAAFAAAAQAAMAAAAAAAYRAQAMQRLAQSVVAKVPLFGPGLENIVKDPLSYIPFPAAAGAAAGARVALLADKIGAAVVYHMVQKSTGQIIKVGATGRLWVTKHGIPRLKENYDKLVKEGVIDKATEPMKDFILDVESIWPSGQQALAREKELLNKIIPKGTPKADRALPGNPINK